MKELTSGERCALRARAHHLHPVVMVGNAGLTAQVIKEIDANLRSHELIKIRMLDEDRDARARLAEAICEAVDAKPVQHIGKILVIYRPKPAEEQKKVAKPRAKRKLPRKTKRNFQKS
ncbi:MAG TPA: ribosome assembly RNA-binding protein YhbY, partial [Burkholderiales bacterium]|nr:ribosome assembly RNA-binding protein YhbY [Burkholderiales bacterium]